MRSTWYGLYIICVKQVVQLYGHNEVQTRSVHLNETHGNNAALAKFLYNACVPLFGTYT